MCYQLLWIVMCLVCHVLPVTLDCHLSCVPCVTSQFLVFSNVYLNCPCFTLSFIFVMVCDLFEENDSPQFFFIVRLCLQLLPCERGMIGILSTGLALQYLCACPKPGPGFLSSYVMVFFIFSELRWEVILRFVDISFLFIKEYILKNRVIFYLSNESSPILLHVEEILIFRVMVMNV